MAKRKTKPSYDGCRFHTMKEAKWGDPEHKDYKVVFGKAPKAPKNGKA